MVSNKELMVYGLTFSIGGKTPLRLRAIANLRTLVESFLSNDADIEVVDGVQHLDEAIEHHIVVTPTRMKVRPEPTIRIIGDLSQTENVAVGLGILV